MTTRRPHLLVIDDDPDLTLLIRDVAERCGYDTESAPNGRAAQAVTKAFSPDAVVVDMVMPEADGIEYIRWLCESGFDGQLILTSGYDPRYLAMAEIIARSGGLVRVEILSKPIRAARLAASLSRKPGA